VLAAISARRCMQGPILRRSKLEKNAAALKCVSTPGFPQERNKPLEMAGTGTRKVHASPETSDAFYA
jgi:hypothetical protein